MTGAPRGRRWHWLVAPGIATLVAAVFASALDNGFVNWDDDVNITRNLHFRGFSPGQLRWMFTTTVLGQYIPLTWLSFAVDHALWGLDPRGYHATNVFLHAVNAALVFVIARRLLRSLGTCRRNRVRAPAVPAPSDAGEGSEEAVKAPSDRLVIWAAATAALVFGLHPLRVESVAWVTERRDVLSLFFGLLAVWAYLRAALDVAETRRPWLAASLAAFTASLLAKQLTMTLPLVLVILDVYPLRRRALREKIPFACLGLGGALVALWAIRTAAITPWEQYGLPARFAMTMFSLAFYVSRTVLPVGLSPLYELPKVVDPWTPRFVLATVATLALTGSAVALRRRAPWFTAAWTAYVVMLMPIAGPVHAGRELAHDRYSYLACLPWALLAGAGVGVLQQAWRRGRMPTSVFAAAATAGALALGLWGYLTVQQIRVWRDSLTLWQTAVEIDPECVTCQGKLGQALLDTGHFDAAARELTRAIALEPERPTAHNTLGSLLYQTGRYAEAAREWSVAARLGPRYAEPLNNLGVLHARLGNLREAARFFEDALRIQPEYPEAQNNLARARARALP